MGEENKKPYILYVAEAIYLEIFKIKKQNIDISNIDAIERFMGCKLYEKVSSGKFHDEWFEKLKENDFIAICDVGAYGMSLSSNYNLRPKPVELLIKGRTIKIIKHRQKHTDLI